MLPEPLYPPPAGDQPGQDPGALARLAAFFAKLLGQPTLSDAERLGWGYLYDEDGSLLAESGTGGANSTGSTQIVYLPTAAGPMPIVLIQNGQRYAVHADHLHTPRLLTNDQGQAVWQWAYSGFGEEPPTTAATRFADPKSTPNAGTTNLTVPRFNLRFPGQVFDEESGLFYNYFRTYDPRTGRYTQGDPIGLEGGWNRFGYVNGNPLSYTDPNGLNPVAGAYAGAGTGSAFGPVGTVVGGLVGAGVGAWIGWNVVGPVLAKPPENAYDPSGPKAPGKPGEAEDFKDPKGGENWIRNPNGRGYGWQGADGGVWCPTGPDSGSTGDAHGGPHWDVQYPGGRYDNVYPGGRRR